jgi:hypothetical protein
MSSEDKFPKEKLNKSLDMNRVKDRRQAGITLKYLEAWDVINSANDIFGHGNWERQLISKKKVNEIQTKDAIKSYGKQIYDKDGKPKTELRWHVSYIMVVRVTIHGIPRDGTGAGHGISTDLGLAHESAAKEAESDAMKRAFMTFGYQFGLALYDKDLKHVEYNGVENSKPKEKIDSTLNKEGFEGLPFAEKKEHMIGMLLGAAIALKTTTDALWKKYFFYKKQDKVLKGEEIKAWKDLPTLNRWLNTSFSKLKEELQEAGFEYDLKTKQITESDIPF